MSYYTTLARAKSELIATSNINDDILRRYINEVSNRIDLMMGFRTNGAIRPAFLPYTEARQFAITSKTVSSGLNTLLLSDPLLSLTSLSIEGTTLTSNVQMYPANEIPCHRLRMNDSTFWGNYVVDNYRTPPRATVTGVWGYNADYGNAWQAVDTLQANINATVTSLTVADVDGADLDGFTPRISEGNYIRIDDEVMQVNATNTTTNVVTVRRGVLGTIASAHVQTDAIEVYQVDEPISRITARQAGLLYARRGSFTSTVTPEGGTVSFPADLLYELTNVLKEYQYV